MVSERGGFIVSWSTRLLLVSLFILFCASLVHAANVTVNINNPGNDTYLKGTVVINVTFGGQLVNITNFTLGVTDAAGTFFALTNNRSMFGNNYTEVLFSWATDNGTFADGAGYTLNVTVNSTNISGSFFPGSESGNFNFSTLGGEYIIDNTVPNASAQFKDTAGNIKTKFTFGSKINIDCLTFDQTSGLNSTRNTVRVKFPGLSTFHNITLTTNSNTTLKAELKTTETTKLGDYIVECVVVDTAGHENLTNRTLTIERQLGGGNAIFGTDWVPPISRKVIGKGTVENFGVLPEAGEARLMAKKGSIIFTLGGEDVTITVEDIDSNSADLSIGDDPTPLTLSESETKQVDTDSDGYDDLEIFLNKIHTNKADMLFKEIYVPVQAVPEPTTPERDEVTTPVTPPKESSGLGWLWFLLVILLVIIIIMFVVHKMSRGDEEGGGPSRIRFTPKDLGMRRDGSGYALSRPPSPGASGGNQNSGGSFY